jgi:hypothetical protein
MEARRRYDVVSQSCPQPRRNLLGLKLAQISALPTLVAPEGGYHCKVVFNHEDEGVEGIEKSK